MENSGYRTQNKLPLTWDLCWCFAFMNFYACSFVKKLNFIPTTTGNWRTDDVQMMWGPKCCLGSWIVKKLLM